MSATTVQTASDRKQIFPHDGSNQRSQQAWIRLGTTHVQQIQENFWKVNKTKQTGGGLILKK
jgi:hypothetical protein